MPVSFLNCCDHVVTLNNGLVYEPSGFIGRIRSKFSRFDSDNCCDIECYMVEGLPEPKADTFCIVSAFVKHVLREQRNDLVTPATSHPRSVWNGKRCVSVPGFIK